MIFVVCINAPFCHSSATNLAYCQTRWKSMILCQHVVLLDLGTWAWSQSANLVKLLATKALWHYFYYYFLNKEIFCGPKRKILNVCIYVKNLGKILKIQMFTLFWPLLFSHCNGCEKHWEKDSYKVLRITVTMLAFWQSLNLNFFCSVTNLVLNERLKKSYVSESDRGHASLEEYVYTFTKDGFFANFSTFPYCIP